MARISVYRGLVTSVMALVLAGARGNTPTRRSPGAFAKGSPGAWPVLHRVRVIGDCGKHCRGYKRPSPPKAVTNL
jgi:hypothetical protein